MTICFLPKQLKEGIQLRSNTFQLIRAAFDEEVGVEEVESFRRNLQALRYPESLFHFFAFRGGHQYFLQGILITITVKVTLIII